jgi:hypothetical protein
VSPNLSFCSTAGEIAPEERAALEQSSLRFVRDFLGDDPAAAYAVMTAEAQRLSPEDRFRAFAAGIRQVRPLGGLRVVKTHFLRTIHWGKTGLAPCFDGPSQAFVAVGTALKQAHVVVEGEGQSEAWAFALWLMPEQGWRVEGFHATPSRLLGKSASDMRDLARRERDRGHDFNAAILFAMARDLAYRGEAYQPRIVQEIGNEMGKLRLPPELQGQPPFAWRWDAAGFTILQLRPTGFTDSEGMYLSIIREAEPWSAAAEPERRNRELIMELQRAFPEYEAVFAGVAVEARERGSRRGYRTLETAPLTAQ